MKGYHGSPKETHKIHGGKESGTHELMVGSGPGKSAMSVKTMNSANKFEGGEKTSGMAKGLKKYSEE